ncbi:hypothetical protein JTB14_023107 [Gonioctena quinquepunctata]|nr:hypothetical protein JTB14_023107 [Gonioctena quinquepunctata]
MNISQDYLFRPDSHEVKTPFEYSGACFGANICFHIDRYFKTLPLLDRLREKQLHGTGTIMLNQNHNHKKLNLKEDSSMKRGDIVQCTSEDVALVKWWDNRTVLMAPNSIPGGTRKARHFPGYCSGDNFEL